LRRVCWKCGDHPGSFEKHCPTCLKPTCDCEIGDEAEEWNQAFGIVYGFRLQRRIGQGGQSKVWWGVRVGAGRPVEAAIKIYANGTDGSPEASRADAEAKILEKCGSPGVPRLLDYGRTPYGNLPVIVMEYCANRNFDQEMRQIEEEGDSDAQEVMRSLGAATVMQRAAMTLAIAHGLKCSHFDVKPSNMLVHTALLRPDRGEFNEFGLMIVDWGNGRQKQGRQHEASSNGEPSLWLHTPDYCSPEFWRARSTLGSYSDVTMKADIYGLGVSWYRTMTGRPPWEPPALLHPDPRIKAHDTSTAWQAYIERCTKWWSRSPTHDGVMLDEEGMEKLANSPAMSRFELRHRRLVTELLLGCLKEDPDERPSAMDIAYGLRAVVPESHRLM